MKIKSSFSAAMWWAAVTICPVIADESATSTAASKSPSGVQNTIIVLDASGSMWGKVQGESKIDIARRAIEKLVGSLPKETHLGLVVYGHRKKGDCADIELLIEPQTLNPKKFTETVATIMPKGMTPLTSAIEFAAENLAFKENKATVILVSDGKETCDRDPCEAAKKLEKLGVDFTAHVVAFDLSEKDARSIECIAKNTGGRFLKANDASTLTDALQMVLEKEDEKKEIKLDPAMLKAPAKVPAGSRFKVEWKGPNNKGDYITIVPKDFSDGKYKNYAYTRNGSPLQITALMDVGDGELRYMSSNKVLGRLDIEITPVTVTLEASEECLQGYPVSIEWTGPNNKGDYITIVSKSSPDGKYKRYQYTKDGSPVKVEAPMTVGDCEIRYMSGQGGKVLARFPIKVNKAEVTLKAADECFAGNPVSIEWTGPNNKSDYITIVSKSSPDGKYKKYKYTKEGSPVKVAAPMHVGDCEIRYMSGQGGKVLSRLPITVKKAEVTLKAAPSAQVGEKVSVQWTGPNNKGDYLVIVEAGAKEGKYLTYTYTRDGSPLKIRIPKKAGDYEIRYTAGQNKSTLQRIPLKVVDGTDESTQVEEK